MEAMIALEGEVIERQSFLNGTRYLLIEAEGDGWTAQLALTLPREEGEPLREGDLALSADQRDWQGVVASGTHRGVWDDTLDAAVTEIRARCTRVPDAQASEPWEAADLFVRCVGDAASVRLEPLSA